MKTIKQRFIAGARCPKCKEFDTIKLVMSKSEHIKCVNCSYIEYRPKSNLTLDIKKLT